MQQSEFDDWLTDAVTQEYMQFLRDWADVWARQVHDAILSGRVLSEVDQHAIHARKEVLGDILALSFEDIDNFYKEDNGNSEAFGRQARRIHAPAGGEKAGDKSQTL